MGFPAAIATVSVLLLGRATTAFVQLPLSQGTASSSAAAVATSKNTAIMFPSPSATGGPKRGLGRPRSRGVGTSTAAAGGGDGGVADGDPPRVLCHGEVLFDCIATPAAAGWELDRVVAEEAWKAYPGGAPANVACALSKLGVPAGFVGAVGEDSEGDELLGVLEKCGVNTQLAARVEGYPTRTVMVTRDTEGDRTFAGFGDGKPSDSFADCHHRLSEMEDSAKLFLRPGSWVVQGTLGLASPGSLESHLCLAKWAKEAGALRFLDINWRPVFWELAGTGAGKASFESLARERIAAFSLTADVVKLTDEEAEWLSGVPGDEALRDPSCLKTLFPAAKAILVTAGANGAGYLIGGQTGFVPSFRNAAIVETTGAGDAFSAGFIAEAIKCLSPNRDSGGGGDGDGGVVGSADGDGVGGVGVSGEGLDRLGRVGAEEARGMVRFAAAVGALTCGGDGAIAPQPLESDVLRLLSREEEEGVSVA